jgi:hypothetical protein
MVAVAVLGIIAGALGIAGGVQELVIQGIVNSRSFPLVGGTLGTVAGAFLLAAGIATLRRSEQSRQLAIVALAIAIPVYALIGVIQPLAGWLALLIGIAAPIALLMATRRGTGPRLSRTT